MVLEFPWGHQVLDIPKTHTKGNTDIANLQGQGRGGAKRLEPPQDGALGAWQGGHIPVCHARQWAGPGKAANSGTDLGALAAVEPCRANLTFFPLPGERGGIIQGKHSPRSRGSHQPAAGVGKNTESVTRGDINNGTS